MDALDMKESIRKAFAQRDHFPQPNHLAVVGVLAYEIWGPIYSTVLDDAIYPVLREEL